MERIECIGNVVIEEKDAKGEIHRATNHPGAVIDVSEEFARAEIAAGRAKAWVPPQENTSAPEADKTPAAPLEQAGAGQASSSETHPE